MGSLEARFGSRPQAVLRGLRAALAPLSLGESMSVRFVEFGPVDGDQQALALDWRRICDDFTNAHRRAVRERDGKTRGERAQ